MQEPGVGRGRRPPPPHFGGCPPPLQLWQKLTLDLWALPPQLSDLRPPQLCIRSHASVNKNGYMNIFWSLLHPNVEESIPEVVEQHVDLVGDLAEIC